MKLLEIAVIGLLWIIDNYCDGAPCGSIKCVHGQCNADICLCDPCYTGPTCELLKNKRPTFEKSNYDITIDKYTTPHTTLLTVKAIDEDKCPDISCGCGTIIYSILDESAKKYFEMDEKTGEIKFKAQTPSDLSQFSFIAKATNKSPFDNTYDTTTVYLNAKNVSDQNILRRYQRAAPPMVVTFKFKQSFPTGNLTSIKIGQRVSFELEIVFPEGQTIMTLELFGPEIANEPVMMLCNVNHVKGADLTMAPFSPTKSEGPNGMTWPHTHIVYQMTVSHSKNNPGDLSTITLIVKFDAVMMYTIANTSGTPYYVSAGAEYLNGSQIWVGQLSYTPDTVTPKPDMTYELTGDSAIYPDRTAVFEFAARGPNAYMILNVSLFTPYNNSVAMSMCVVYRYSVGICYSCLPTSYGQPALTNVTFNNKLYYPTATMNLGNMGNMYYIENQYTDANSTTLRVKISARINPMIWVGSYYYLGASVTNGTNSIFSTYFQVQAKQAPPLKTYSGSVTTTLDYFENIKDVGIGSPAKIVVNISIPAGTELDYNIKTSFENNLAEICGISLLSAGMNVPCVDQMNFTTTYRTVNNAFVESTSTMPGVRHVKVSDNAADDILQILVTFRPTNDSSNTPGKQIKSQVTVSWNGGQSTTVSNSYTLKTADATNVSAANAPTFSFQLKGNDGNVSIDMSYNLLFTMRLVPGIFYSPASLLFFMPTNDTSRVKICSVNVIYAGKNILCFNQNFINAKFIFTSKTSDKMTDKIELPFGTLCSVGPVGRTATMDDELQISIYFVILPHPMNSVGANMSISAGMMITPTQIWVGYQPLLIINKGPISPLNPAPVIFAQRIDALNNMVWQNDMAIIQFLIKTPPGQSADLALKISSDITTPDTFGVCQITIKEKGVNIPCINGTLTENKWSPYSKYNKDATFTFIRIINSGTGTYNPNGFFDDNSILVEAMVKFGTVPPSIKVTGSLSYNSGTVSSSYTLSLQNEYSRFNGTVTGTEPVFDMSLNHLFNDSIMNATTVAYSEAVRSIVSVQVQPGVLQSLKIIFASTPSVVNQMDVVSVNILSVGRNIPCLVKGMIGFVVQQRSSSLTNDLTSVDLGTICHKQISGTTNVEDNKIYLEAIFRIWKVPTGNPTSLQINVLGLLNNDQIYVTRILFNASPSNSHVTDINMRGENIKITASASPAIVQVGNLFVVNVTILVPPYSQYKSAVVRVFSDSPVGSDSFYFVGGKVTFSGVFGKNIGINPKEPLLMTLTSSSNTSQLDTMIADFGIVQNTATTYLMGQNNYTSPNADDTISILITVRLTDNMMATDNKDVTLNVGAIFGSTNINTTATIKIKRTKSENISFNISSTLLSNKPKYQNADIITASVQAQMVNTSSLECRNFTIYVAAPPFILFGSLINSSYSSSGFSIKQTSLNLGGFTFVVPYFFYTETLSVVFTMTLQPSLNLSRNRVETTITIPVIYGCQTLNWPDNPQGNKWISNVDSLVMDVKGNDLILSKQNQNQNPNPNPIKSASTNPNANCKDDLGLSDSNKIKDCQITAFMSPNPANDVLKIRKNSGSYWEPHVRNGQYNKLRYVDIKFGEIKQVAKVAIFSTVLNKPKSINIYGTMDGRSFTFYGTFSVSYTGNEGDINLSQPDFIYRGIRIGIANATEDDKVTGMNLDLIGCTPPSITDSNKFDPCVVKSYTLPTVQLPEFYNRGFLYVDPYLFVCDDIASRTNSLETAPRCFRTKTSSATTWEDLGNQVGKVIGFDGPNKIIYAISWDLNGYIMSEDNGLTWTAINNAAWKIIKAVSNLQSPTPIPWTSEAKFDPTVTGSDCNKYSAGTISFCYDGIYSNSQRLFTWNNCC